MGYRRPFKPIPKARRLIDDPDNQIVVSIASIWEIAIKHALPRGGPNDMPISGAMALAYFRDAGFELLDIAPPHAAAIETLAPLHADPFDRMLVAQALTTPLRLLTHDSRIAATAIPSLSSDHRRHAVL